MARSEESGTRGRIRSRPTRRQDDFAGAYYLTGCAARAAREAGYNGRYAAQAGYKLLKRGGTIEGILWLQRLERLALRSALLRALARVRAALEPLDTPEALLKAAGEPLLALARALGLGGDPACALLARRLARVRSLPRWRRFRRKEWEERERRPGTAA